MSSDGGALWVASYGMLDINVYMGAKRRWSLALRQVLSHIFKLLKYAMFLQSTSIKKKSFLLSERRTSKKVLQKKS